MIVENSPGKAPDHPDGKLKVGMDNIGYEDIIGRHKLSERNESGDRFANLCTFDKIIIGGKMSPHKRIHKATWVSPDYNTENKIYHIYVAKKFRKKMVNVRTRRGVDIVLDHHLSGS